MKNRIVGNASLALIAIVVITLFSNTNAIGRTVEFDEMMIVNEAFEITFDKLHQLNYSISQSDIKDVVATLTFSQRLTFAELEEFIGVHEIQPVMLEARAFNLEGDRITLGAFTIFGLAETERLLLGLVEDDGYEFAGIISMGALIDSHRIRSITSDSRTFIVDTTHDAFFRNYRVSTVDADIISNEETPVLFPKSFAWELEDLGIIQ